MYLYFMKFYFYIIIIIIKQKEELMCEELLEVLMCVKS